MQALISINATNSLLSKYKPISLSVRFIHKKCLKVLYFVETIFYIPVFTNSSSMNFVAVTMCACLIHINLYHFMHFCYLCIFHACPIHSFIHTFIFQSELFNKQTSFTILQQKSSHRCQYVDSPKQNKAGHILIRVVKYFTNALITPLMQQMPILVARISE